LNGIKRIVPCYKTNFYAEKGAKYTPDQYVVVRAPEYPVCKIVETYESCYEVEEISSGARWHFKHNQPMVALFENQDNALIFRKEKVQKYKDKVIYNEQKSLLFTHKTSSAFLNQET
jgi:uncharacterized protein with NAD-binding domain and iron-sulfur cluster